MKYLKTFEVSNSTPIYWKIPTKDPDLEIALSKIPKCLLKRDDFYINDGKKPIFDKEYEYIARERDSFGDFNWYFVGHRNDFKNFIYKGEIEVTDKDRKKYMLNQTLNKYNL